MVAAFVLAGVAIRVLYVLSTRHIGLAGDEIEYDHEARFILDGHSFWTTVPYGIAHAGLWKAPGYPVWLAGLYEVVGTHLTAVRLVQVVLLGSANMVLAWLLARRLFGARAGLVAAGVMAVYPLAFMFDGLLYSEGLGATLTLLVLLAGLQRDPTPGGAPRARGLGAAGVRLRPLSLFLFSGGAGPPCGGRRRRSPRRRERARAAVVDLPVRGGGGRLAGGRRMAARPGAQRGVGARARAGRRAMDLAQRAGRA